MKKLNNKGVTLVEITIAISLVVMISSIAFTNLNKVQEKAKINTDKIVAANLASAASIYRLEENNTSTQITTQTLKDNGYINTVPKSQSNKEKDFIINVVGQDITVSVEGQQFYPIFEVATN